MKMVFLSFLFEQFSDFTRGMNAGLPGERFADIPARPDGVRFLAVIDAQTGN
jgi:hypothetical protein